MIIYPAIDLRGGQVVRLREGNPGSQITFSTDPIATARNWLDQGATWIHMVNLDGAFNQANDNGRILEAVAAKGAQVQFGGGLRSLDDVKQALNQGASRVIIGTLAIKDPDAVAKAVETFGPDRICVALDARDGKITTHGWTEKTDITPADFGRMMAGKGVKHALYTDVHRDGGLQGANISGTIDLARETGLQVIASGGVTRLDEIKQLAASGDVAGAIIGMALYENKLNLADALQAAQGD